MKISQVHLNFWESKQPHPAWARKLVSSRRTYENSVDLVDSCINANASVSRSTAGEMAALQLVALCQSYRKRGTLRSNLLGLTKLPGTVINPEKRAAFARKWLAKISASRTSESLLEMDLADLRASGVP